MNVLVIGKPQYNVIVFSISILYIVVFGFFVQGDTTGCSSKAERKACLFRQAFQ